MDGERDPLGIVQEKEIWPTIKWNMHKLESTLENETHNLLWDSRHKRIS